METEIEIEGAFNVRGFGGYPSDLRPNALTRNRILYRSGHLKDVKPDGWTAIRELSISTIIDLTSSGEAKALYSSDTSSGTDILDGPKFVKLPLDRYGFSIEHLSAKYKNYIKNGPKAVAEDYFNLLVEGHETIRAVLLLIRDNRPGDGLLIHCSLGKDRTGIVFALLLSLAGVDRDVIAEEYSLTGASLQHFLPKITQVVKKSAVPEVSDAEALQMAQGVVGTRKEAMLLTFQMVDEAFGGTLQYVSKCCGIGNEDIERIQQRLVE